MRYQPQLSDRPARVFGRVGRIVQALERFLHARHAGLRRASRIHKIRGRLFPSLRLSLSNFLILTESCMKSSTTISSSISETDNIHLRLSHHCLPTLHLCVFLYNLAQQSPSAASPNGSHAQHVHFSHLFPPRQLRHCDSAHRTCSWSRLRVDN